ncbi:type III secretion system export apparatus subunit SctR [Aquamicrobium sp. LC103]|uniref:type III secretion system export apparatus subunit SctR n=1 Tax=Aquamicrobium sp. LC103 TaxID=1120658 RepID=UPI00063E6E0D|nr:type III secretion system export apparatus subunit SctR [Aquamicrobium sp. LC103]TKT69260.1 EscR/YscR/HrcR family type III secretion system export apparatus protein [Aquamicrobium sp. LC103]
MLEGSPNLLAILVAIAVVGVFPLAVVTMTGFLKISIVLFLIRNALGVQQTPPNLVLYGIALVLTVYVTTPLLSEISGRLEESQITFETTDDMTRAAELIREPLKQHLLRFTRPEERQFFLEGTQRLWPEGTRQNVRDDDLSILVPAFVASELTRAFEIGFLLYLPFLIVDVVVANILMTLGMIMVSPVLISIPLKLFLFVAVDGWSRLMHGLILSYG